MLSSQYKSLTLKYGLLSKNLYKINCRKGQYNINSYGSLVGLIQKNYRFASKKPNIQN